MELLFVAIGIGAYVLGILTGLLIDTMTTSRTRKAPTPLLGVVLPRDGDK
jgi:hypothetical protein